MTDITTHQLPDDLTGIVEKHLAVFNDALTHHNLTLEAGTEELAQLPRAFACSEFIAQSFVRQPQAMLALLQSGDLLRAYNEDEYLTRLQIQLKGATDEPSLMRLLRHFRRREMVRLAWRDICGGAPLLETLKELSLLAEACVRLAIAKIKPWLEADFGMPLNQDGTPMDLVVLGMGKLGAYELNYSSDIDLIFSFPHQGETQGGRRSQSHGEFFARLGRQLVKVLDENTPDGFVFRTDIRLRPFGDAGQLALSFDAMESYYERHGREWERYALIKARVISGNPADGEELMQRLKPFVYRRYLDYGTFESLRDMKAMIAAETKRKGLEGNVKTGPGGIREIEFIAQAFQLIRGGREARLQRREILEILPALGDMELLPPFAVKRLIEAYHFLRITENRIQAFADQQTHSLPNDPTEQARLAFAMNFDSWEDFLVILNQHRGFVRDHFDQVFAAPQAEENHQPRQDDQDALNIWHGGLDADEGAQILEKLGFEDGAHAWNILRQTYQGTACRAMGPRGAARMDKLMPLLIPAIAATDNANTVLLRVAHLLDAIARRTAYLSLLVEHPMALSQLVRLFAISPWVAEEITRFPLLLDELLDPRRLYEPVPKDKIEEELRARVQLIDPDDLELRMDVLRQFKRSNTLRVAAAELTDAMPVERVSDHLTWIAEVVLDDALHTATNAMSKRHGRPFYKVDDTRHEAGFAIIGYGKLGGLELGFGSDLDLVFLNDTQGKQQSTDGDKPVDNAVYFARLAQRITHLLNTQTSSGVLYEVDTRLRPSGGAGLLVSNIDAFAEYQHKEAWIWEHQALVRARAITGASQIIQRFNEIRREVLCLERDPQQLQQEVRNMRQRMRDELDKSNAEDFHLKQGKGGIVDIEFIIQYLVLRWAHKYSELTTWTDNLRIIETLEETQLLASDDAKMLHSAYLAYRHQAHRLALQRQPGKVSAAEFRNYRDAVSGMWQKLLE